MTEFEESGKSNVPFYRSRTKGKDEISYNLKLTRNGENMIL